MRAKSTPNGLGQVFAVSGINTISFAIIAAEETKKGLLGFAVQRIDPVEDEDCFMAGFKVFKSVIPNPTAATRVSTFDHPVQSFVWDDFKAKSGREYGYRFHPLKGKPKKLDRSTPPPKIKIAAEPLVTKLDHDVFFNRGLRAAQAFQRRFGTKDLRQAQSRGTEKWEQDLPGLLLAGSAQQRKALLRKLIKELRAISRDEIVPTYKVPALVRAPMGQVVLRERCANRGTFRGPALGVSYFVATGLSR